MLVVELSKLCLGLMYDELCLRLVLSLVVLRSYKMASAVLNARRGALIKTIIITIFEVDWRKH